MDYNNPTTICDTIIHESNKFAIQNGDVLDLSKEELYAFLGILVFMGFHNLPSVRLYWSEDENFQVIFVFLG